MNIKKHLKIAGALQVAGGINMLAFGIYGVVGNFFNSPWPDSLEPGELSEIIYVILILALIFLLGGVQTWVGISIVMQKRWTTRIGVLIFCALGLVGFPVGTAISGYILWVLIMARGEYAKATGYQVSRFKIDRCREGIPVEFIPILRGATERNSLLA